jgi:hypothetical protein
MSSETPEELAALLGYGPPFVPGTEALLAEVGGPNLEDGIDTLATEIGGSPTLINAVNSVNSVLTSASGSNLTDNVDTISDLVGPGTVLEDLQTIKTQLAGSSSNPLTKNVNDIVVVVQGPSNVLANLVADVVVLGNSDTLGGAISILKTASGASTAVNSSIQTSTRKIASGNLATASTAIYNAVGSTPNALAGVNAANSAIGTQPTLTANVGVLKAFVGSTPVQTALNTMGAQIGGLGSMSQNIQTLVNNVGGVGALNDVVNGLNSTVGSTVLYTGLQTVTASVGATPLISGLNTVNTRVSGSTSTPLITGVTNLASLIGGSDDLIDEVTGINELVGGDSSNLLGRTGSLAVLVGGPGDITDGVTIANDTLGGSSGANLFTRVDAIDDIIGGTGTVNENANSILVSIGGLAANITDNVAALESLVAGTGTNLTDNITAANDAIGGSANLTDDVAGLQADVGGLGPTIKDSVAALNATVGGTGDLTQNVNALNTAVGGTGTIIDNVDDANAVVGGSSDLTTDIAAVFTTIGGVGTSITANLETVLTSLGGTGDLTEVVSDVNTIVGSTGTTVDRLENTLSNLSGITDMDGLTSFTVTVGATIVGSTITIVGNDGTPGQSYSYTVAGFIGNGQPMVFVNGSKTITFRNESGGALTNAGQVLTYMSTNYPPESVLQATIYDQTTALTNAVQSGGVFLLAAIAVVAALVVNAPSGDLQTDVQSIGDLLLSTPTGTLEDMVSTLAAELLATPTGALEEMISAVADLILTSPSGVLETDVNALIEMIFSGKTTAQEAVDGITANMSGSSIYDLNTQLGVPVLGSSVLAEIGSGLSVQVALVNLAILINNDTTFTTNLQTSAQTARLNINSLVMSLPGDAIRASVSAIASDGSGGVNVGISAWSPSGSPTGAYNIDATQIGSGISPNSTFTAVNGPYTITLKNMSTSTINTQQGMLDYLNSVIYSTGPLALDILGSITGVLARLGGSQTSILGKLGALTTIIGGNSTMLTNASSLSTDIGGSGASITENVQTLRTAVGGGSGSLTTNIGNVNTAVGGGGTLTQNVDAVNTAVGGSSNLITNVEAVDAVIGGTGTLISDANAAETALNGFVSSLPNNATTGTVSSIVSDGSGGVNVNVSAWDPTGNPTGSYNIASGTITSGITASGAIVLTNSGETIILVNTTSSTINTQSGLLSFLNSMIVTNQELTTNITDTVDSLRDLAGGSSTGLWGKIGEIKAVVGGTSDVNANVADVDTAIGGSSGTITANVASLDTTIGGTSGNITDNIGSLNAVIGGSGDMTTNVNDIVDVVGGSSALTDDIGVVQSSLNNFVVSLPNDAITATVASIASDGSGGANINISAWNPTGNPTGNYNISGSTISGGIASGATMDFTNSGQTIVLRNTTALTINGSSNMLSFLNSMITAGENLAVDIIDTIESMTTLTGGTGLSLWGKIGGVNAIIGGTGTVNANAAAVNTAIGGTSTMIVGTAAVQTALGGTGSITTRVSGINATVGGVAGSVTANLAADLVVIGGSGSLTSQLSTANTNLGSNTNTITVNTTNVNNELGGTGATQARVDTAFSKLAGITGMSSLTSFTVTIAASNTGSTVTITGNDGGGVSAYSITFSSTIANGDTFTLVNSSKTITFVNNSGSSITSAANLATYLAEAYPVNTVLKNSVNTQLTAVNILLGTGGASIVTDVMNLTDVITGTSVLSIATQLGTPTGNNLLDEIGSGGSIQEALDSLSTLMLGNANFSSSLESSLSTIINSVSAFVVSLPDEALYALVGSVSTDGGAGVQINVTSGIPSGAYIIDGVTITNGIANGSTFSMVNGGDIVILRNRSGSLINTQTLMLNYLLSMIPVNGKLSTDLNDILNTLLSLAGGNQISLWARMGTADRLLLNTPTGVIQTDINAVRALIVTSPGSAAQADVQTVNTLIDGTATGSTIQARIGGPLLNAISSNLSAVIGGSGSIAAQLGDPGAMTIIARIDALADVSVGLIGVAEKLMLVPSGSLTNIIGVPKFNGAGSTIFDMLGGTAMNLADKIGDPQSPDGGSIAGYIDAPATPSSALTYLNTTTAFSTSQSISDQLATFLNLFDPTNIQSGGAITFTFTATPTSLADMLNYITA